MTARRPAGVSVHDWQHQLVDERVATWKALPHRSGLDRLMRREAEKKAFWTAKGHLKGHHGLRALSPFATLADVLAMHDQHHAR